MTALTKEMHKNSHYKQIAIISCKNEVVKLIFALKNLGFFVFLYKFVKRATERTDFMPKFNILFSRKKHVFTALMALFLLFSYISAYADALGTPTSNQSKYFSQGTVVHTNTFWNTDVGKQTERYVEYTPNSDVLPVLTNGNSVYGKRTLSQANNFLINSGINSAIGMNADFFSLKTGIPMSNVIIDKKIISKDSGWLPAVGFRADGTAFMGTLPITTTLTVGNGSFPIECINKYRQPYALYLFTEDFGNSTYAEGSGINVVLSNLSGDIRLNSSISATIESIDEYDGAVAIPKGKMILSVDLSASDELKQRIAALNIGDKITLDTKDAGKDKRWNDAIYALGAHGGKLITNGKLDYTDDSAAPRTAIGIKADGNIIFYTIDGRQSGYSFGVRKETLARRLLELGCVDAINLDGGGSTTLGGVLPGTKDFTVLNSPSDGKERSCANFIFLKKMNVPTGVPYILNVSHWGVPVLSGSTFKLEVISAYDSSYGPADIPKDIVFSLEKDAGTPAPNGLKTEVSKDGWVTIRGNGDVFVKAEGGNVSGSTMIRAVATPDEIRIYNADTEEEVKDVAMFPDEKLNLSATAYWGGQKMILDDKGFTWRVVSDDDTVGTLSSNGTFTAKGKSGSTGIIAVNAGLCTTEIPVRIRDYTELRDENSYPEIKGVVETEAFVATVTDPIEKLTTDNIRLYIDGNSVEFEYNEETQTLLYEFPRFFSEDYHRIVVTATNSGELSAMSTHDVNRIDSYPNAFPDTSDNWAKHYISYMSSRGIVKGNLDGNFSPNNSMTRTEFAIMLCNYLGVNPEDYADITVPFTDYNDIPWWAVNYVKAIYSFGIMQGQLTDYGVEFNPNSEIKRMEYAISIERLLPPGLSKAPIQAIDENEIPFWAKESLKLATAQGILKGYPDGTLRPHQSVTRAEAVKILHTIFGAKPQINENE